jgi:hypothetical protein
MAQDPPDSDPERERKQDPDQEAEQDIRVRSLDALAREYGFSAPDEFVGPRSSSYILDYGPPEVLSDSDAVETSRQRTERKLWELMLKRRLPRQ